MTTARTVEELDRYGSAIDDMPRGIILRQALGATARLRGRYGIVGLAKLMFAMGRERRALRREHPETVERLRRDWGPGAVNEALSMSALFRALVPVEGRDGAYEVAREIFQHIAPASMRALYQSDELAECEGDRFENFKRFHLALFDNSQELFPNTQIDEGDAFSTTVTRCGNVEVFSALGCPELGRLGCDHDLAGYPAIVDRHDVVFRRTCAIAKGGDACRFRFYRTGTEPETETLDGVPILWNEVLNR